MMMNLEKETWKKIKDSKKINPTYDNPEVKKMKQSRSLTNSNIPYVEKTSTEKLILLARRNVKCHDKLTFGNVSDIRKALELKLCTVKQLSFIFDVDCSVIELIKNNTGIWR